VGVWHGVIGAVAAFALAAHMILVLRGLGDPGRSALSSSVRQLMSYVTARGIGCLPPAAIGVATSLLAGLAAKWHSDCRLLAGRCDRVGLASSAELISDAPLRPS
jgi:hypothetical protein